MPLTDLRFDDVVDLIHSLVIENLIFISNRISRPVSVLPEESYGVAVT